MTDQILLVDVKVAMGRNIANVKTYQDIKANIEVMRKLIMNGLNIHIRGQSVLNIKTFFIIKELITFCIGCRADTCCQGDDLSRPSN